MIYVVMNAYRGIVYFASSQHKADEFIDDEITHMGGGHVLDYTVHSQKIDDKINFEVDYG